MEIMIEVVKFLNVIVMWEIEIYLRIDVFFWCIVKKEKFVLR